MAIESPYRLELAPTLSGHWYDVYKGRESLGYMPSATTILHAYPQSPQLTKWIAQHGYHESQRIKNEAGKRGTHVHNAIEDLLNGQRLTNEGFSLEEWHKICVFAEWYKEQTPKVLGIEVKVVSEEHKYAGTADLICEIGGSLYVVDWKTSSNIHKNFHLQFAAYAHAFEEMTGKKVAGTGGVQLGAKNKKGFRMVSAEREEWKYNFKKFLNVYETWKYDWGYDNHKGKVKTPPVLVLPETLKL